MDSLTPTFRRNDWPTLGVEVELQLLDARSMALKSAVLPLLGDLPPGLKASVKPEFMQCYVEVNTGVCRAVDDVANDLATKVRVVEAVAARQGVRLGWAATHPFSRWQDQQITPNERYYKLAALLQETVVRPVTFGLHVHVGVASGDHAIRIANRLRPHLPLLLALSANSPFFHGRATGYHSHRTEVLEGCPTGGMPPTLAGWDEYQDLLAQLKRAQCIESHRDLWWDVRPNDEFGTIEIRICDMPPDLPDLLGLVALIQCLVHDLGRALDAGEPADELHWMMIRQNRWRACRFGLGAELIEPGTLRPVPARRAVVGLVRRLRPVAEHLGCLPHLNRAAVMATRPNGAEWQLALQEQTGDLAEVVRRMLERSHLGMSQAAVPAEPVALPSFHPLAVG